MTTSNVLRRLYRFCGSDWTRTKGFLRHRLTNKLRWTFKLWYLVDVRTVLVTGMVQAAIICIGCYLGVREVQKDAFDYPRMQLIGQAVYRFGILLICCFGEHYFARRAMRNENHADLIAVGLLSMLLGGAMLAESLAPRHATAIHPPLWVGVGCALISGLLLFVSASMYRRLGWRQLMRFGSAPAKRVMYVRLKQHETLVTLDLLCMMALGLATVRTILFALDEERSGAWQLYVSCAAWVLGAALDLYLKWLSVHEKKVRTLVCAILGCLPRGWFLYLSVLVFAGNPTDPIAGAPSRAPSPSPVVTSSNASSTVEIDEMMSSNTSSTVEIDEMMAASQLALAIVSACVRLAVTLSSFVVALFVYGHGVSLFGDEKDLLHRVASIQSGLVAPEQSADADGLPSRWRTLPEEARKAIECVVRGKVLDVAVFESDETMDDGADASAETSAEATADAATSSGMSAAARAFVQYSPELETLRWSWTDYIGVDQVVDVRIKLRDGQGDGETGPKTAMGQRGSMHDLVSAVSPAKVAAAATAALGRKWWAREHVARDQTPNGESPEGLEMGFEQTVQTMQALGLPPPRLEEGVLGARSDGLRQQHALKRMVRIASAQMSQRPVVLQIVCHSSLRGQRHTAKGGALRLQTLFLASKDAETLFYWYVGLRLLVLEHRAHRPPLTSAQVHWVRNVFDALDRNCHGFVNRASVPRLLAAANTSASVPIPKGLMHLSLPFVQRLLANVGTAPKAPTSPQIGTDDLGLAPMTSE